VSFPEHVDYRFCVPQMGVVTHNDDQLGLHRVRICVPGLVEPYTGWAFPMTIGGGSPQRGGHVVPAVGADVVVQWIGGDHEHPIYSAAHWGIRGDTGTEVPQSMVEAGDQAHLVQALQVGDLLFTVDSRPRDPVTGDGQQFTIRDLKADRVVLLYDLALQGWSIEADYLIQLKTTGIVRLEGMQLMIGDRLVRATSAPI